MSDAHDHAHAHVHKPGHGHHQGHAHGHAHAPKDFGRAFAIGVALNLGFVVLEGVYGLLGGSIALLADAGHNLGDVLGLAMVWGSAVLVRRMPSPRFTYGLRRATILAALCNAVVLLVSVGAIAVEGLRRLFDPGPVASLTVMAVAASGIVVNAVTAWMFAAGRRGDINIRAAFAHMATDALVSAGVVATGAVILLTGWVRLDPLASLAIAAVIAVGTWGLLRDTLSLAVDGVPAAIEPSEVRAWLAAQPGITGVHDLHVWAMSTTETALTVHLVMAGGHPGDAFLAAMAAGLRARFGIGHATAQIEMGDAELCHLTPEHVV